MLDSIEARRARIHAYDLGFLRASFRANHPQYARRFSQCVRELRRLFEVMLFAEEPVEVTSPTENPRSPYPCPIHAASRRAR